MEHGSIECRLPLPTGSLEAGKGRGHATGRILLFSGLANAVGLAAGISGARLCIRSGAGKGWHSACGRVGTSLAAGAILSIVAVVSGYTLLLRPGTGAEAAGCTPSAGVEAVSGASCQQPR